MYFLVSVLFLRFNEGKVELFGFEVCFDEFNFDWVAQAELLARALAADFVLAGYVFEEVVAEVVQADKAFGF